MSIPLSAGRAKDWPEHPEQQPQQRAESRNSAHALVAKAVVQLQAAMSTLRDANHAADPVVHLHLISILRELGAVSARVGELENAMAMMGKR